MYQRLEFRAMGGQMLAILDQESGVRKPVLDRVPQWFEAWERCLSRFRPDSELSILNRTVDQAVHVSDTLWEVAELARFAETYSDGLLTPTILSALVVAGYDRDLEQLKLLEATSSRPAHRGPVDPLAVVLFDEAERSICLPAGVQLDFGGVAKGWAAHEAMLRLASAGPALVDAAGDIAISGPNLDGSPWIIGVADPFHPERDLLNLQIHAGGVATSGKDRRRWMSGDLWQHHLIDPRTGLPSGTDLLTVTVVANTVMEAEIAAKTIFLQGRSSGLGWAEAEAKVATLLVMDDGEVVLSSHMKKYIQ
jgi:thiamine biosynthesis lipoprotein